MKTAIINLRIDADLKREATKLANEMGISLSALINALLKQMIRTKEICFSLDEKKNKKWFEEVVKEVLKR